jgi:DNA-binding response OmpR family regulator
MKDERMSVLIVEDDELTATFLADNLEADGFRTATATSAAEGWRALEVRGPDLLVLDLMLGEGASGLELLDRIRHSDGLASRVDPEMPVIVLTGRAAESDRVRGFARGADDYVLKPFLYGELLGRINAVLRRARARTMRGLIRVGDLTLDPSTRAVRLAGEPVILAAKEFALLLRLAQEPTRVFTKHELLRDVWGWVTPGTTRTLDAHACRLRRKLLNPSRPFVVNARGVGYRLTES